MAPQCPQRVHTPWPNAKALHGLAPEDFSCSPPAPPLLMQPALMSQFTPNITLSCPLSQASGPQNKPSHPRSVLRKHSLPHPQGSRWTLCPTEEQRCRQAPEVATATSVRHAAVCPHVHTSPCVAEPARRQPRDACLSATPSLLCAGPGCGGSPPWEVS